MIFFIIWDYKLEHFVKTKTERFMGRTPRKSQPFNLFLAVIWKVIPKMTSNLVLEYIQKKIYICQIVIFSHCTLS